MHISPKLKKTLDVKDILQHSENFTINKHSGNLCQNRNSSLNFPDPG